MFQHTNVKRVGWVIADQLDHKPWVRESTFTGGGIGMARYFWLSEHVNQNTEGWHYEIYRPWKRYDAVVFLKSMNDKAYALMEKLQRQGVPCIFDVNVNYFYQEGKEYYPSMFPSEVQQEQVKRMTQNADAVIADSSFVYKQCKKYNEHTRWIPDIVNTSNAGFQVWKPDGMKLRLLWSGQSVKLFELLAIEDVLLAWRDRLELVLITNDLEEINRLYPEIRTRLRKLLSNIEPTIIPYESIQQLFSVYANGGVFVSPRFLDNHYNMGHTEWKITLAMACGRVAICSPVPSYEQVAERSGGQGILICHDIEAWSQAFDALLSNRFDWEAESCAARKVVEQYYSPVAVVPDHIDWMMKASQLRAVQL
jgi:glycosyltransferase involved in cell wall biosynthesis